MVGDHLVQVKVKARGNIFECIPEAVEQYLEDDIRCVFCIMFVRHRCHTCTLSHRRLEEAEPQSAHQTN